MSEETHEERYADVDTSHLDDVEDGCGCTEMWEHTSEREADAPDEPSESDDDADSEATVEAEPSG